MTNAIPPRPSGVGPAITLMVLAPLIAELLPGATRLSAIFVLPIEILVWGGGAMIIRWLVRRFNLGWRSLALLALALALAEECIIQQTSFAPLVIKLKGVEYARMFGVNYVYLLWALIYESVFVVIIPIGLCDLIFPSRRDDPWLGSRGVSVVAALFVPGAFLAWYSWTQIARTKVFHLPDYSLPVGHAILGAAAIISLVLLAAGPARRWLPATTRSLTPPRPVYVALLSGMVVAVLFALVLLGFGMWPDFPPAIAVLVALGLAMALWAVVPAWLSSPRWTFGHSIALLYSSILSNLAVFFVGFIGAAKLDLYGKIGLDLVAAVLLAWLLVARRPKNSGGAESRG